jgi:hypothetical protein
MSGDSQTSFSPSVRNSIRQKYSNRCSLCLSQLPEVATQSAHLIDAASAGASQVRASEIL